MLMLSTILALGLLQIITSTPTTSLDVPLRFQWNENNGYCGESCVIASGLAFGQYLSQYDIREIADVYKPSKTPQTSCQLLIGANDVFTAGQLRLESEEWKTKNKDTKAFLVWMKQMFFAGNVVTFGVYMNEYLFYGRTNVDSGDPDYDHIVSLTGVDSQFPNDDLYHDNDVLYFSDNALWNPRGSVPQYIFNGTFKDIQGNREDANSKSGNIYTLSNDQKIGNYGIAITGVSDSQGDTFPVRVTTSVNYETPEIENRSDTRPKPMALTLSVTVSKLQAGVQYVLYRYSDESVVPSSGFNKNSKAATKSWNFVGAATGTYTITEAIQSSDKAFYRAVRADAI